MNDVAKDQMIEEYDDDGKRGGGGQEDQLRGEEEPRGAEGFGLDSVWEERRLGDDGRNKQPLMYVWASGGDTQEI